MPFLTGLKDANVVVIEGARDLRAKGRFEKCIEKYQIDSYVSF